VEKLCIVVGNRSEWISLANSTDYKKGSAARPKQSIRSLFEDYPTRANKRQNRRKKNLRPSGSPPHTLRALLMKRACRAAVATTPCYNKAKAVNPAAALQMPPDSPYSPGSGESPGDPFDSPARARAEWEDPAGYTAELEQRVAELEQELADQAETLKSYRQRAAEQQRLYEEIYYSRTWRLSLALREAFRSPRALWQLPGRVWRILTRPPAPSAPPAPATLPGARPVRSALLQGWPRSQPLVTVAIPCYNYGRYLGECVDSVLASTLADFEVLVVDDGSDEPETLRVLESLSHPQVRVVRETNRGAAAARNLGAALGRGKYVVCLDADDRISPTYLEKASLILERFPHYGFCYPLVEKFGEENGLWLTEHFDLAAALRRNIVPAGAMFRREAWAEAKGFREGMDFDDWNFWITLGAQGWQGCLIPEPLYFYRCHEDSLFNTLHAPLKRRARSAELVRELHSYLLAGDESEREEGRRRAETYGVSKHPAVREAIEGYQTPGWRPEENAGWWERRFLPFSANKPAVLVIQPWLAAGGAEQLAWEVIEGLRGEFAFVMATARGESHAGYERAAGLTPWIYQLPNLRAGNAGDFLRDLAAAHGVRMVLVNWAEQGYHALPKLKQAGLWTADIVHNAAPEGRLAESIRYRRTLDLHIAVGAAQAQALKKAGAPEQSIRVIPTAVDAGGTFHPALYADRREEIRRELGLSSHDRVIVFVGRLSEEKDPLLFIAVADQLARRNPARSFRALIAGDGPLRIRVEEEIAAHGLPDVVRLLGARRDVAEVLAASDYFLLTSRTEGSPFSLLEAMSLERAVIAADVGNVAEAVRDGENGFLVRGREARNFVSCVERLEADPELRARVGVEARKRVLERFSRDAMLALYREALAEGAKV